MIDASAADDKERTRLAAEVIQAIDDAGIFSLIVPRELGGARKRILPT